ncbi:FadR family transcriptional regulator [Desulfovibrio sp. OttesenSCG-928-O18]|nr:FadR family transcriptional regulator [Desulfovibrio sp. OttesenSCG-928-O18]
MQAIQSETLVDKVVDRFMRDVRDGVYAPGERLPSHEKLQELFGVSRNTLREALTRLGSMGVLRIVHGNGTFVNDFDAASSINNLVSLLKLKDTALDEVIEARIFVEEKTARLAAERATDEEKQDIAALLEEMERCVTRPDRFAPLDTRFHQCIASCAHNPILQEFYTIIGDLMRAQHVEIARMPQVSRLSHELHVALFQHIEHGNADGAAAVMRQHIEQAYGRLKTVPGVPAGGKKS